MEKSRKILMLNALTEQSGSGVRFLSIAQEIARRGHAVFFLERAVAEDGRVKVKELRYRSVRETGLLWLDILRATLMNVIHGLVFRPEYVFALKPMPNTAIPALFLKKVFKSKVIVDIDDLDFEYYPDSITRQLVRFFFKCFPPRFDLITTHNGYLKQIIIDEIRIPPEKIYSLAQGIEIEEFLHAAPATHYQKKWNLQPDDNIVVYSASLGITSDFQLVLPMLIEFLKSCNDAKILVVGEGVQKKHFIKKIEAYGLQEQIFFTGYINHAEMPSVLKLAKVGINYMAPTQANRCRASIKVREYLAAGLNVVCNPVGDSEVFGDHVTLCSTLKEYPEAIRAALEVKAQDRIGSAQAFLEANYSWPDLIEHFLAHVMG